MDITQLPQFITEYEVFKQTPEYEERKKQLVIVPVLRRLIAATLQNEVFTKEHLTGLLQACHGNRSAVIFEKYLNQNVTDEAERAAIMRMYEECGQRGITGGGKGSVYGLGSDELAHVYRFLLNAFEVSSVAEAQHLVRSYDALQVSEVKQGVYSAWLYYINPSLFPIYNASHRAFKDWLQISENYAECIVDFARLREAVGGDDLGMIDRFAYKYSAVPVLEGRDLDAFTDRVNDFFAGWWRCATSGKWEAYKEQNKLSIDWLDADVMYKEQTGKGHSIRRWVNKLKTGDLIAVFDKHNYFGLAIAGSEYGFATNDVFFDGQKRPAIDVHFIHTAPKATPHGLKTNAPRPATFGKLDGGDGFPPAKEFFRFLDQNFPEALDDLEEYMNKSEEQEVITKQDKKMEQTPNIILYGPPGTGKTFHSISYAVAIVEGQDPDAFIKENEGAEKREEVKRRYDAYMAGGQIQFCTFHQSLGYEDFIEGIKPEEPDANDEFLKYHVRDGIFKEIALRAAATVGSDFERAFSALQEELAQRGENQLILKTLKGKDFGISLNRRGNLSLYTGNREKQQGSFTKEGLQRHLAFKDYYKWWIGYYDSVIQYMKDKHGFNETASAKPKPYVLIIDEINRGNVSSIFGELITLLEADKRLGKPEALRAKLPYSGDSFGVPPNLYIIGTMNTADRSVEALDTALRRRFEFVQKGPKYDDLTENCEGINLKLLLEKLNRRLTILIDEDHTIGHAWLWNVTTLEDLRACFKSRILPLLREYFYNDYEKLGRVLGENFFLPAEEAKEGDLAPFSLGRDEADDYSDSVILKLKEVGYLEAEDFKSVYE